jgi:hypothetical protein
MAYAAMGDVAAAGHGRAGIRLTSGTQDDSARMWYQRSLDVFRELEAGGLRAGGALDDDEPELVAALERKLSASR